MSVKVLHATLGNTGTPTVDITSSGFGTPTGMLCFSTGAYSGSDTNAGVYSSIGVYDGTSSFATGWNMIDNLSTTDTRRTVRNDSVLCSTYSTSPLYKYTAAFITDGVRLTLVGSAGVRRHVTVVLFGGSTSCKAFSQTPAGTVGTLQESGSLGIEPRGLFCATVAYDTMNSVASHAIAHFGASAESNPQGMSIRQQSLHNSSTTSLEVVSSNSAMIKQNSNFGVQVVGYGSDTVWLKTIDASAAGQQMIFLAVDDGTLLDIAELTTPTATGTDAITSRISPEAVVIASTLAETTDTFDSGSNAEGFSIGIADSSSQFTLSHVDGDNISTSNSQSRYSSDRVIDLQTESSGFSDVVVADLDSFQSDGFTLNYTTAPGTAKLGWWVSLGSAITPTTQADLNGSSSSNSTGGATTVSTSLTGTSAGDAIVVAVSQDQGSLTTITVADDVNGAYTAIVENDANSGRYSGLFYFANGAGGNVTITVTSSAARRMAVTAWPVENVGSSPTIVSGSFDNTAVQSIDFLTGTSGFTVPAGAILFGAMTWNAATTSVAANAGYTAAYSSATNPLGLHVHRATPQALANHRVSVYRQTTTRQGPGVSCYFEPQAATPSTLNRQLLMGSWL